MKASFNFVPTPSVPETRTGARYFAGIAHSAPKPPSPARTSGRMVRFANGLMASTSASPASISTPASRYERGPDMAGKMMSFQQFYVK